MGLGSKEQEGWGWTRNDVTVKRYTNYNGAASEDNIDLSSLIIIERIWRKVEDNQAKRVQFRW
jgi:hypothetical protein